MENCNLYTGEGHFLETDIQYLKNLHDSKISSKY